MTLNSESVNELFEKIGRLLTTAENAIERMNRIEQDNNEAHEEITDHLTKEIDNLVAVVKPLTRARDRTNAFVWILKTTISVALGIAAVGGVWLLVEGWWFG